MSVESVFPCLPRENLNSVPSIQQTRNLIQHKRLRADWKAPGKECYVHFRPQGGSGCMVLIRNFETVHIKSRECKG